MLCCRCGVTTDGVEVNPGHRDPICPACAKELYDAGKRALRSVPTKKPSGSPTPARRSKRRKKS